MVKIYLAGTPEASPYIIGDKKIEKQNCPSSNMFFKYQHNRTGWLSSDNIQVYEQYSWSSSFVTLKATGIFNGYSIYRELVYFNKCNDKVPLILVLLFRGSSVVKHKFYRLTNLKNDLGKSKNIEELEDYTTEESLLSAIIEENDKVTSILTYDIGRTKGDNGTNKYNGNKIKLTRLETPPENNENIKKLVEALKKDGFRIYTHKDETQKSGNKYCYTYKNQLLMNQNKRSIKDLMNKNYNINVYFGFLDIPLLAEFSQSNSENIKSYFYLKQSDDGSAHWEKITKGYVLGVKFENEKIHEQLTLDNYEKLLKILNSLRNKLTKTIFFIIDSQDGTYDNNDVERIVGNNEYNIMNDKIITVKENKENLFSCIFNKGFRVMEHNFSKIISNNKVEQVELKFIIPNGSGNDVIIKLIKSSDSNETDSLIYLNNVGNNKLYTYFYGADPRPLLLCYNGQAYRPKDLDDYEFTWVRVKEITSFWCNGNNTQLLSTLNQVVCFLNVVNISEKPSSSSEIDSYDVHIYNNKQIQINLTIDTSLGCYKAYVHKPSEEGYRLGNIEYKINDGEVKGSISYDKSWNNYGSLIKVCAYYYNGDKDDKYPLLIILEFKNPFIFSHTFVYYSLSGSNYRWSQIYGVDFDKRKLLNQLYKLNKRFNFRNINDPESECLEKSKHTKLIIGSVISSALVGAGLAIAFYLHPHVFLSVHRWLL